MRLKDPASQPTDLERMMTETLGRDQVIRNNFIPAMFYALACDQALKAVNAGYEHRETRMKKAGHRVRAAVNSYAYAIRKSVGAGYGGYLDLLADYDSKTSTEQWLSALKAREDCSNSAATCRNPDIGSHAVMARAIIDRAIAIDIEVSRAVSAALGKPCTRRVSPEERELALALDELIALGYGAELSPIGREWLRHIEIKTRALCDQYLAAERLELNPSSI